jgi:hypothetical protein
MLRKTIVLTLAALLVTLAMSSKAQAWGFAHYGYHYGGYGGGYHYGYHYGGYGGGGGYHYGGYHYGGYGGGYHYGYHRAW